MSLAEILPSVRSFSAADKLRLIRVLAEEVDLDLEVAPLERGRTYVVSTPPFVQARSHLPRHPKV